MKKIKTGYVPLFMVSYISQAKTPVYNDDVLVTKTKGHTVIVVSGNPRTTATTYSGTFPALPPRGYYKKGDGYQTLTNYKMQIKRVQQLINWAISVSLTVDGEYGAKTETGVKAFQTKYGLTADGYFGSKTLAKAKTVTK